MLIVFTTVPDHNTGEVLAEMIVNAKLAACVQILPQMMSVYIWDDAVQKEPEHLLLIKTLPEKWDELREFIAGHHSYSVPEVVAIDAEKVSGPYRKWLEDNLKTKI
jgi:uncharacterized protein involved in tolerance to divalent cations